MKAWGSSCFVFGRGADCWRAAYTETSAVMRDNNVARMLWLAGGRVGRDRDHVAVGQPRDGRAPEIGPEPAPPAPLHVDELADLVARRAAGDARHRSEPPQVVAVAEGAPDRAAAAAGRDQRFAAVDRTGGHIRDEPRTGVARHFDDPRADGLRGGAGDRDVQAADRPRRRHMLCFNETDPR